MKKALFLILMSTCSLLSNAQEVQWAFRILDFSSQKGPKEYAAKQALGKPNVLPSGGENIKAWQPKGIHQEEFIKVGFLKPMKANYVAIAESMHPGYISKVFVYDAQGREREIASYSPKDAFVTNRLLNIKIADASDYIIAVKVTLSPLAKRPVAIDAIGITESNKPIELTLTEADVIKSNMVVKKLDKKVNSIYPEFGPLLTPDGKTLYFSRRFDPKNIGGSKDYEDIWYANWNEKTQQWGEAKNMGIPINNKEPNFINSISPDGNSILLGNSYEEDGSMSGGASISRKTATGWSFPKRLLIEGEENTSDRTNFFLANSQKVLLMSVKRKKDTFGGRDLYVSFLKKDSSWTKPLNLGASINTIGTESAPFLAADERTLYFASDGFSGYGGSDIYVARRLDSTWTKWSEPENLGPIVNTAYDESYFTLSASGNQVYFTSTGDVQGDVDIYTLEIPRIIKPLPVLMVRGRVLDSKLKVPLPDATIIFENLSTGQEIGLAMSDPTTGEYQIVLPSGINCGYHAEKIGYASVSAHLDLETLGEYSELSKDLYLTPIEIGQSITLNNIFFDYNHYEVKRESRLELNRLAILLRLYPGMRVEISGHTDNIGSEAFNDQLSFQRADAVLHYLVEQLGINSSRIELRHYGELKPLASNASEEGRHANRRVEFKIVSIK